MVNMAKDDRKVYIWQQNGFNSVDESNCKKYKKGSNVALFQADTVTLI